ncbi:hypothetical protein G9P44_001591 [Scheffersomyces stipitis]|nr:hypothetical protein G9P44_001591 [Scheffersomyces stipitis]
MSEKYQPVESYELKNSEGDDNFVSFMDEIQDIRSFLDQYSSLIGLISQKQTTLLQELEYDEDTDFSSKQVESLVTEARALQLDLKNRIKSVQTEAYRTKDQIRLSQAESVRNNFLELIQQYQLVESNKRAESRAQAQRQYKIIQPDATEKELQQVAENPDSQQYFQQALLKSNRSQEATTVLKEVQVRHHELLKLERTMAELSQLFNDMEELVIEQDEAFQNIDENVGMAQNDIEQGVGHTYKAVESAKSYRKKKKWLIIICILIVIIIAAVLGAYFATK